MSEATHPSSVSDSSAGNENGRLRRAAPARSSRRIAKLENEEDTMEPVKSIKKDKKTEKRPTKSKNANESDIETVITESGLVLHPNGTLPLISALT
jgi:hypothetical protein